MSTHIDSGISDRVVKCHVFDCSVQYRQLLVAVDRTANNGDRACKCSCIARQHTVCRQMCAVSGCINVYVLSRRTQHLQAY
jgi:hypothetical protein